MLEARSLTKYYDHKAAVRQVSFTIRPGEILGYLGPNGAGKSTTVKMLVGLVEPSEGQIFYHCRSVYEDFAGFQQRIGYVPEEPHLYPHLSGREYLQLIGRLRAIPSRTLEPKLDEFLRLFGLAGQAHAPLTSYSKGMRQKVLLSAALLHDPEILILDEPFSGLDVTSALMLRSLLRTLASNGKIILYSSHVLEVVEKICSNVLILRRGEVVAHDSIENLRDLMKQPSLEAVFSQLADVDNGDELANNILDVMSRHTPPRTPQPSARPVEVGRRVYRGIAGAMPDEFQNVYGDEMVQTAEESMEPVWRREGLLGLARMLADAAVRVPIEHLTELRRDVRYALRMLRSSPGFTLVALLSLSLGIAIATCSYSEVNGLLRDLPLVPNPRELVGLGAPVSYPAYQRFRQLNDVFSSSFAYIAPVPFGVSLGGRRQRTWGHLVTPTYFSTLGVHPLRGRFFNEAEEQPGQAPPAVISYRFWQEQLGSDPMAVGGALRINGYVCTIVGIAPEQFRGASPTLFPADVWLPVSVDERLAPELAGHPLERRDLAIFHVSGRLQPHVSEARAQRELTDAAQQLAASFGELDSKAKARRVELMQAGRVLPIRTQDIPFFRQFLMLLGGLVLLIACANVANMMLARATDRRREITVRLALGASRRRLIRQLLTESMLVSVAAALPALPLCYWLMHLASGLRMPWPIPVGFDLMPDWRALVFTLVLAVITGLAFGLAPALQATRTDLVSTLKEGGNVHLTKHRSLSLRNLLMLGQMAVSLTLLLITGYLGLGIQSTLGVQQGFDPKNLYLMALDPVRDGYSPQRASDFFDKLLDRVRALPGVTSACLTDTLPVATDGNPGVRFSTEERDAKGTPEHFWARKHVVGHSYFETAGIRILAGRSFRWQDEQGQPTTVIVTQETVRLNWKGADPVGRRIRIRNDVASGSLGIWPGTFDFRATMLASESPGFEIVGVAANVSEDMVASKKHPAIYFPLRHADLAQPSVRGITLLMRGVPGVDVIGAVRHEISAIDPDLAPFNARSMAEHIDQYMSALKGASWTYGMIGLFGLILSSVGVAGVTAYSVAKRAHEIGIRMALGAQKRDVLALVMKEGAALVTVGTLGGLLLAWMSIRALSGMFFTVASVHGADPVLLVGAPLLLGCLALLSCYLPARRSTRIDPVITLRQE